MPQLSILLCALAGLAMPANADASSHRFTNAAYDELLSAGLTAASNLATTGLTDASLDNTLVDADPRHCFDGPNRWRCELAVHLPRRHTWCLFRVSVTATNWWTTALPDCAYKVHPWHIKPRRMVEP